MDSMDFNDEEGDKVEELKNQNPPPLAHEDFDQVLSDEKFELMKAYNPNLTKKMVID